ncbi:MAG: aminoglycoside phosphotransferase family protein [Planctomycetes bacterium]|nr:aminoglycoside phosphotransferase family protein [Planctomycetota bacterium]
MTGERETSIAARRERARGAAAAYVGRRLLPRLGLAGASFELAAPGSGLRSVVFFLSAEGRELVLRLVEGRGDARWLAAAVDLFAARSLPAPRPVCRDVSVWTRLRWGWAAFVEERVQGVPASAGMPREALRAMGRAYGRVHAVGSDGWDRPHALRRGDYMGDRLRRAARLASEAADRAPAALAVRLREALSELESSRPPCPVRYSLCHNRVTPSNVVLGPCGECVLIDLERVKFGSCLEELARIEAEVLGGSQEALAALLEGYREPAPRDLWPESDPAAWRWYRRLAALRAARDAALRGDDGAAERALGAP